MTAREMTAEEFDRYFDEGGDISDFIEKSAPSMPNKTRRVTLNLPSWLVDALDRQASHLAIPRQSVAITWLAERAQREQLAG